MLNSLEISPIFLRNYLKIKGKLNTMKGHVINEFLEIQRTKEKLTAVLSSVRKTWLVAEEKKLCEEILIPRGKILQE